MEKIEEYLLSYDGILLRKFMSRDEIRVANRLVDEKKLLKGTSDDSNKSVIYYRLK